MHKKETSLKHCKIANEMVNYINTYIDTDINISAMAIEFKVSKFHFHRIFKEQMGENIYETIKSIRLQKASNLLITNQGSTISKIASMCGYSSQTSFLRAFKQRFNQTPKQWRKGGYKEFSDKIINSNSSLSLIKKDFSLIEAQIVKIEKKVAYYIREKGLGTHARQTWQKLKAWVYTNNIINYSQVGIYHDNPIITKAEDCHYVAAIMVDKADIVENSNLPFFNLYDGLCAKFPFEGKYEDILKFIQWVYHYWLPNSGYEATTIPSYIKFEKNDFFDNSSQFKANYYLPIRFS
ncbi:MAG: AraC family transcriptional regulator [Arcobacter sp.]|nr:AraC family transcriptional regulator [Arcobacter sp.]|tara:strand:+ start:4982 stop:5863 length:882 start_codon:yes stop_codon:yes gene_type:complete